MRVMRRLAGFAGAGAVMALLAGCVEPTPYAPAPSGEREAAGFTETKIEPDRWRVAFAGNSATSREEVEVALLLRAAEVTLGAGGDWFRVVDEATETDTRQVGVVTGFGPYPYGYGRRRYGAFGYTSFGSIDTREIKSYRATMEILVMEGEKPAGEPAAYDASAVAAALGPRVRRADAS
ncbi:hypothetical protein G5B40_02535 [Pikeienuella piscinae]|uniref:DUF4136 domain-containing protein n=1 Tax=Pikeienuella piscinae TaxID=2748098 RepID=A0A7L5BSK4_9RHOB|nr:hypothetical protein [Pikeienuella piscinae]QIE54410.1 hypothetical protein G5B40_02535 [Pikeienuella piscinae]